MSENKNSKILKFPINLTDPERQVEAVLFAAEEPLDIETIQLRISKKINIEKTLESLKKQYSSRGINLVCTSKNGLLAQLLISKAYQI